MNGNVEPVTAQSILARSADRQTASAPVVVGMDDTPLGAFRPTLLAATAEAVRRHVGILLVHGCEPLVTATSFEPGTSAEEREATGRRIVAAAAELVAQQLPDDWPIELCVDPRSGAQALEELSEVAALIVLQRRQTSAIRRWHTGSTTSRVAARAKCPVVVIRENNNPTPPPSVVVVGVDERGHAGTAVDVAFAEADLRATGLIAVHAWQPPDLTSGFIPPDPEELAELDRIAQAELAEALAGHCELYPDVVVHRRVVSAPVVEALVQACEGAELLVVGRHGQQRVGAIALGSVARHCLKQAPCPVMITPVHGTHRPQARWLSTEAPVSPGY